jgi:hypothetical protein
MDEYIYTELIHLRTTHYNLHSILYKLHNLPWELGATLVFLLPRKAGAAKKHSSKPLPPSLNNKKWE